MKRLAQLLTLDLIPRMGIFRLSKKLTHCTAFDLFKCSHQQLVALGFANDQVDIILHPPQTKIDTAIAWLNAGKGRAIISYYDDNYPPLLKEISAPPLLLFCQGDTGLLASPQLAIVGSRAATYTGKDNASQIAEQLALHGYTVTSGLALGIDSFAHQGALTAGGKTIAVLGSGLDVIYPKANLTLAQTMVKRGGLLVSEFWPDIAPYASNFPRRNRIVSGLSLGVIVVEAEARSGSLITARLAVEQNREVFAVPGSINNPKTAGCHKLIHQGAKLITGIADILEELPQQRIIAVVPEHKALDNSKVDNNTLYDSVLASVEFEVTSIDQMVTRSNKPVEVVLEQALNLELAGLITSSSGGYIRIKGDT